MAFSEDDLINLILLSFSIKDLKAKARSIKIPEAELTNISKQDLVYLLMDSSITYGGHINKNEYNIINNKKRKKQSKFKKYLKKFIK